MIYSNRQPEDRSGVADEDVSAADAWQELLELAGSRAVHEQLQILIEDTADTMTRCCSVTLLRLLETVAGQARQVGEFALASHPALPVVAEVVTALAAALELTTPDESSSC